MKTTYRIAIAELRSLFCSPVAWLILVIFAVQVGVAFGNAFDRQVQGQALGYIRGEKRSVSICGRSENE